MSRLIDADALKSRLVNAVQLGVNLNYDIGVRIDHTPTIEERPTGEWIADAETFYKAVNEKGGGVDVNTPYFTEDDIACSECLALFSVIDNCTELFNFCPNCGAKMHGGNQNDASRAN